MRQILKPIGSRIFKDLRISRQRNCQLVCEICLKKKSGSEVSFQQTLTFIVCLRTKDVLRCGIVQVHLEHIFCARDLR